MNYNHLVYITILKDTMKRFYFEFETKGSSKIFCTEIKTNNESKTTQFLKQLHNADEILFMETVK